MFLSAEPFFHMRQWFTLTAQQINKLKKSVEHVMMYQIDTNHQKRIQRCKIPILDL